jgi:hypothetical protein
VANAGRKLSSVPVRFDHEEWAQGVERLDERKRLDLRLCEGEERIERDSAAA